MHMYIELFYALTCLMLHRWFLVVVDTRMSPADHVIYQRQLISLYLFENYLKNLNPLID